MMRAFENRPDTNVIDEPFYAYYLKQSGADHPMGDEILSALPQKWQGVADLLNGPAPETRQCFSINISHIILQKAASYRWTGSMVRELFC